MQVDLEFQPRLIVRLYLNKKPTPYSYRLSHRGSSTLLVSMKPLQVLMCSHSL